MFDIAPTELLVVAIVALVVIGPKDLPKALRFVGNWVGKARRMAAHFRAGVDNMVREAELEELKKDWEEQNRRIMAEFPNADDMSPTMREANPGFPAESAGSGAGVDGATPPPPVTDGMVQAPADAPSRDAPKIEAPESGAPKSGGAGL
ncbi:twin-arginine translocase subunit TatB [Pseudonocardia sp. TMWB2A]|uniref:Sec-independent protein translocase protein TatB n=1 Tax=Pseudonocardia sp. TMWB2A TaxID=687430 RepID=UPI00307E324F